MRLKMFAKSATIATLIALGATALQAQEPAATPHATGAIKTDFSQEQLVSFAKAAIEINEINVAYQEQASTLQQSDPAKAQELGEQANAQMHQAIVDQGLDVQQYQQIAMAAQADEQFRNKLLSTMRELVQ